MITELIVQNFKSIRDAHLDCRRVNVVVGGPNAGKSNLLEALSLLSWLGNGAGKTLSDFVRVRYEPDLFYRNLLDQTVRIEVRGNEKCELTIGSEGGRYVWLVNGMEVPITPLSSKVPINRKVIVSPDIRFYRPRRVPATPVPTPPPLLPPDGPNLFETVNTSTPLRAWFADLCRPFGLRPLLNLSAREIELLEENGEVAVSYPLRAASETLFRMLFLHAAITSNRDAVLVFEEPEVHAFPSYVKHFAEEVADDSRNQYVLSTHNRYLFETLLEKTPTAELRVFVAAFRKGETRVRALTTDEIAWLQEGDPLLQVEALAEEL